MRIFVFMLALLVFKSASAAWDSADLYERISSHPNADSSTLSWDFVAAMSRETDPIRQRRIREAYKVLSDPKEKEVYDFYRSTYPEFLQFQKTLNPTRSWDPYEILGLPHGAGEKDIIDAYVHVLTGHFRQAARDNRIHDAFAILMYPASRTAYDMGLNELPRREGQPLEVWQGVRFQQLHDLIPPNIQFAIASAIRNPPASSSLLVKDIQAKVAEAKQRREKILKNNEVWRTRYIKLRIQTARQAPDIQEAAQIESKAPATIAAAAKKRAIALYGEQQSLKDKFNFLFHLSLGDIGFEPDFVLQRIGQLVPGSARTIRDIRKNAERSYFPTNYKMAGGFYHLAKHLREIGREELATSAEERARVAQIALDASPPDLSPHHKTREFIQAIERAARGAQRRCDYGKFGE